MPPGTEEGGHLFSSMHSWRLSSVSVRLDDVNDKVESDRGLADVTGAAVQCVFQEPAFLSSDVEFLQLLGHSVVQSPAAFDLVGVDAFLYRHLESSKHYCDQPNLISLTAMRE